MQLNKLRKRKKTQTSDADAITHHLPQADNVQPLTELPWKVLPAPTNFFC